MLGSGGSGVVFVDEHNVIYKIVPYMSKSIEWNIACLLFNNLYCHMPKNITIPLTTWVCNGETLDDRIFTNYPINRNGKFTIMTFYGRGAYTLKSVKTLSLYDYKCIVFQLLMFLYHLKTKTNIQHGSLHDDNIVLVKNEHTSLVYNIDSVVYVLKNVKFAIMIVDFGDSQMRRPSRNDWVYDVHTIAKIESLPLDCIEFLNVLLITKTPTIEMIITLLNHAFLSSIVKVL
jgi:hypothetical protein